MTLKFKQEAAYLLNDEQLVLELKMLVGNDRKIVVQIIRYLYEVESRRLHLARGFSSMFEFCIEELKMSEAEAHLRIQAARLSRELPEVAQHIEEGKITLSVSAMAQSAFRRENSKRKSNGDGPLSVQQKREVVDELLQCSKTSAHKKLATRFASTTATVKYHFEANKALVAKLERLKSLYAHQNYSGDLAKLIEILADVALVKIEKSKPGVADLSQTQPNDRKLGVENKAAHKLKFAERTSRDLVVENKNHFSDRCDGSTKPEPTKPDDAAVLGPEKCRLAGRRRSRYIAREVRRQVWKRGGGHCTYVDSKTGRPCTSAHALEVDHVLQFSRGGANSLSNLRLLCAAHNKFRNFAAG